MGRFGYAMGGHEGGAVTGEGRVSFCWCVSDGRQACDSRVSWLKPAPRQMSPSRSAREGDICWCCSWCVYRESSSMSTAVTVTDSSREPKHPILLLKKNTRFGPLLVRVEMLVRRGECQTELLLRLSSS
jgi:hypothetical protein